MIIGGLQKTSLIDYPEKIAAIVFTQGCNFRCGYCHNPELAEFSQTNFSTKEVLDFLESRLNKLDGVVITGGEPTLQKGLIDFIREIKFMGYLVKLDTNGTNPEITAELINKKLIDYIAMDIKAPLDKYCEVVNTKIDTDLIQKNVEIILNSNVEHEFRTTLVKEQLIMDDFHRIGELVNGAQKHYLQKFTVSKAINNDFLLKSPFSDQEMTEAKNILKDYVKEVLIR